ncbi:hypothetical protein MAC_04336 [Metarhizium acridum CQMa 102]|uniref:Uncharacterized protein n=1 Tax=Metarhizium acridum (strain CQMa 102) TaxID=655827 RepID=E9E388_METAQ|nr:uncharacterized protein MAC_04336 [Metarhizium acridum CQMa 102]EFY89683.1 hypothetical protein MAC_04336 [Metarhizium acridum CQMa 102]
MKPLALLSVLYPVVIRAVPGDPCSAANGYGDDCICVTTEICQQYEGNAITGSRGKYPCPNDPANVIGCVVKPCHNRSGNTQCLWRKACDNEMKVASCPGGKDFICCNHHLDAVGLSNSAKTGSAITSSGDTQTSTTPATTTTKSKTSITNTSSSETTAPIASLTSAPNTSTKSPVGSSHTTAPATTTSRAAGTSTSIAISELLGGLAALFAALI